MSYPSPLAYGSQYHVWRRSDGYVNVTCGTIPPSDSGSYSFETLCSTPDWDEALQVLEKNYPEASGLV